jgi:hypothetical protein
MTTKRTKSRQEKMVESVLTKAKRVIPELDIGEDFEATPAVFASKDDQQDGLPPAAKRRKPRHASLEGQRLLESRAKSGDNESQHKLYLSSQQLKSTSTASATPEKSKKSKNKKKKKKSKALKIKDANLSLSSMGNGSSSSNKSSESHDKQRNEALSYLQLWKSHKESWKFEKLKQLWLLKHAADGTLVDDKLFPVLLEYIGSVQGVATKEKTLQDVQGVMSEFEGKYGSSSNPNSVLNFAKTGGDKEEASEQEKTGYERARQIVQMLSDN